MCIGDGWRNKLWSMTLMSECWNQLFNHQPIHKLVVTIPLLLDFHRFRPKDYIWRLYFDMYIFLMRRTTEQQNWLKRLKVTDISDYIRY